MAGQRTQSEKAKDAEEYTRPSDDPEFVRSAYQGGRLTAEEANRRAADQRGPGPDMVVVKQDVYEEVHDPGARTTRTRLKYAKGQVIPASTAKDEKVQAQQQQDLHAGEAK